MVARPPTPVAGHKSAYLPPLSSPTDFQAVERTFAQLLKDRAEAEPGETAFCHWDGVRAIPTTWGEYATTVREVALGLSASGVAPGDRVAIMSPARTEWVMAALGVLSVGAIPVGVYPTSSVAEVKQALQHSAASAVFAASASDAAKIAEVSAECPALRTAIGFDHQPEGLPSSVIPTAWTDLREAGRAAGEADPARFDALVEAGSIDQPAALFYTSGSTGAPKGVTHTHKSLQYSVLAFSASYPEIGTVRHDLVGFLGLSHVAPALLCVFTPIMTRLVITFCGMEQRSEALIGVRPTAVVWPPRLHEKLLDEALTELRAMPAPLRFSYALAMRIGRKVVALRRQGKPIPRHLQVMYGVALKRVFLPLRGRVGIDRIDVSWTASGAMTPEVMSLWHVWGLDLRELYGTTETCGSVLAQWDRPFPPPGTVGKSLPDPRWAIRTTAEGELLVSAPLMFRDYWGNPEATAEVMDGSWYHTGDLVEVDASGEVKLIGRLKDIVITSGGKTVSPQPIEVRLKASPLIEEAVIVGDGRKYLSVLIWTTDEGKRLTSEALAEGVRTWITEVNSELARPLQLKQFRITSRALSADEGELTLKGTIRRAGVLKSFAALIDEMYATAGQDEIARQTGLMGTTQEARRR
jgi:long-chain acyl-CoA synthetase